MPKGVQVVFHDWSHTGKSCININNDPNYFVFVYDNKLINAKDLYHIFQKTKPREQVKKNLKKVQSPKAVEKLLKLPEMQNCLMVICRGKKICGPNYTWHLNTLHLLVFFPQVKGPEMKNANRLVNYDVPCWKNQNIPRMSIKDLNEMLETVPPFVAVRNARIVNIEIKWNMCDENYKELIYISDENQVQDVNGNVRPLKDSDEVLLHVFSINIVDESTDEILLVHASDSVEASIFGEDGKVALTNHNSILYKHKYKHMRFHLTLHSQFRNKENAPSSIDWIIVNTSESYEHK